MKKAEKMVKKMDSCSVYSCTPSRWLDSRRLPHLKLEQVFCNKIFVGGTRYGQTMSTIRCETESFATHRENKSVLSYTRWLEITTESFAFHWHTGRFCVTKEHWYWYPRLLCFVAWSWWLHTSCCVTYNLHPNRAGKKRRHPLTSLRTCLGKPFCRW